MGMKFTVSVLIFWGLEELGGNIFGIYSLKYIVEQNNASLKNLVSEFHRP